MEAQTGGKFCRIIYTVLAVGLAVAVFLYYLEEQARSSDRPCQVWIIEHQCPQHPNIPWESTQTGSETAAWMDKYEMDLLLYPDRSQVNGGRT